MGITQLPEPSRPGQPGPPARSGQARRVSAFIAGGAYALLFVLGLLEGTIGSFQYSRGAIGPVPLGSIGFALGILVTCGLAAWAMEGMAGALLPAIGWFVASFWLAMPDQGGSVIISGAPAGEWYLYGGSVCALAGIGSALITANRRLLRPPGPSGERNRTAPGGVPPA